MKTIKLLALSLMIFSGQYALAKDYCSSHMGNKLCIPIIPDVWKYSGQFCAPSTVSYSRANCKQMGADYGGYGVGCVSTGNETLLNEDNITDRAKSFVRFLHEGRSNIKISKYHESKWGAEPLLSGCWDNRIDEFHKLQTGEVINFDVTATFIKIGGEPGLYNSQFMALRTRQLNCPKDSKKELMYDDQIKKWVFVCTVATPVNLGCQSAPVNTQTSVGNPCSVITGNKFLSETDWSSHNSPLTIRRFYNSLTNNQSGHSAGWTHNYNMSLTVGEVQDIYLNTKEQSLDAPNTAIILQRGDGKRVIAQRNYIDNTIAGDNGWFINRDESLKLTQITNRTWQVTDVKTGTVETYQALNSDPDKEAFDFRLTRIDYLNGQFVTLDYQEGQLSTVTDQFGQTLQYNDDGSGIKGISSITLPSGEQIRYLNTNNQLQVTRPGFGTKTYLYDEPAYAPNPNGLITGILDENGKRYATYHYDNQNRGISTEHSNGSQKYTLSYGNGYTQVTTPHGGSRRYNLKLVSGANRVSAQSGNGKSTSNQYDQAGNLISQTDNGLTTRYTYDETRNLETSKIEAFGTPESNITLTEWADNLPVKTKVTEGSANTDGTLKQALRITTYTHDERGNTLTKTITDPITGKSRTWNYTYNDYSQKTSETNPLGLTQSWDYDPTNGNLLSFTDTQGLITTYSNHSSDGKAQTITQPSGQVTTLAYDDAGRITTQTTTITSPKLSSLAKGKDGGIAFKNWWLRTFGNEELPNPVKYDIKQTPTQTAVTTYSYDPAGQLISTQLPDGETITYDYDDAHRLIATSDSLGNRIAYTLNGAGDIIQTDSYDPQGVLAQTSKQSFDTLGRLSKEQGNNGQQTSFSYDTRDNLTKTQDALNRVNQQLNDSFGRTTQATDALNNKTNYTYNALGQLTAVTDSRGNTTTYTINAFGETTQIDSPDTGLTSFDFDDNGQLVQQTDATGRVQAYGYDKLARLVAITASDNLTIAQYSYDDLGRLSTLTNPDSTTSYTYDSAGRVIEKVQTLAQASDAQTVRYHYSAGNKIDEMRLPSGKLVTYQYGQDQDSKGVLTGIEVKHNDNTTQVIDSLTYSPNGITGFNWSQTDQPVSYAYDLDGRLINISDPALTRAYNYDAGNRITSILDGSANINYSYEHDKLDRLLKQNLQDISLGYAYDANSNRTQSKVIKDSAVDVNNISYEAGSNRIKGVSYDASGRILNDGSRTYTYNPAGRIERIQSGAVGVFNIYNPIGQRIQKNSGNANTYFSYDEQGLLIGEYGVNGAAIREYVYLGAQPIAMMTSEQPDEVLQIHSDHLGTPRAVTDKDSTVLWRWEGDAFGTNSPSIATVKMPLRMAGQYADDETGLFYNWHRYYDPSTGRYVTSDPLGLSDGTNPYTYVHGNPLAMVDPLGLFVDSVTATCARDPAFCASLGLNTAGIAVLSLARPKDMTRLEERAYDRYCNKEDDPCSNLKSQTQKAINAAKVKRDDMLADKGGMFGDKGWITHTNGLLGRISNIRAMIDLGNKLGCDMTSEEIAFKAIYIPKSPS